MTSFWENFVLELGLFILLGILYYFYQRRKILSYEENKAPVLMGFVLQSCLTEKKEDRPQPKLDAVIEALDDFLHNKSSAPPVSLLKLFMDSSECSSELRAVISESLREIEDGHGKE